MFNITINKYNNYLNNFMGKIISFSNQKGGTGKTTLAANIAVLWSNSEYKVAVLDADSQKSLTHWLEARKNITVKMIPG